MMFILNFFRGLTAKTILMAIGAAILAFALWSGVGFVKEKHAADLEVIRLEHVVEAKAEAIRVLTAAAIQKAAAEATADAVRAELETLRENYDAILRDADTVKEEDDGPVAPVLRRTIDALGRM